MKYLLALFKGLLAISLVFLFVIQASIIFVYTRDQWKRRRILSKLLSYYCKWMLFVLKIDVKIEGEEYLKDIQGCLVVGNHLSYLDIFILASLYPANFVTSVEMRDTPVLGHLCRIAACVFVERRSKENIHKEIQEITMGLERDLSVTIFPEATSTNGEQVLRFRRPLFNAAIDAKAAVQPFCLQYQKLSGKKITLKNRDEACWYDKMSFAPHFANFLMHKSFQVSVRFLDRIPYEESISLEDLVDTAYKSVSGTYVGFSDNLKIKPLHPTFKEPTI